MQPAARPSRARRRASAQGAPEARNRTAWVALLSLAAAFAGAAPAAAQAWEAHNNANRLVSVAALEGGVWMPSLEGVHRLDPVSGRFDRFFREPGGLASNQILRVTQDTEGTTWLGTRGRGVSLLTATGRWRNLTVFEGLPSDSITSLESFGDGVWVGTRGGLAFFLGTEIAGVWPDGVNPLPFDSELVQAIASSATRTWVGTANGVHTTSDGIAWQRVIDGLGDTNVIALEHDGARLWAVTADGSVWSGGETGTWSETENGLSGDAGIGVAAGGGQTYLGAGSRVYRWNAAGGDWQSIAGPAGAAVSVGPDGVLWAGNGDGLWKRQGGAWQNLRAPGPSGNWVHGLAQRNGTLYVTTRCDPSFDVPNCRTGASRFDAARGWFNYPVGGSSDTAMISKNFVFACLVDREGLAWFGDWDGSIARADDRFSPPRFTHFYNNANGDSARLTLAWASGHDPQGFRWFGLDRASCCEPGTEPLGLVRIDPDGTRNNFTPDNSAMSGRWVHSIAFAPDGTMWVGYAGNGIDVFADRNLQTLVRNIRTGSDSDPKTNLRELNVWGIAFHQGDAYVRVSGSVQRLRMSGGVAQRVEEIFVSPISPSGSVQPIAVDADGGVWIASQSGLFYRPPGAFVQVFNRFNSPLLDDDVRSVLAVGDDVWIGTGRGVNRLRRSLLAGRPATGAIQSLVIWPNPVRFSSAGMPLVLRNGEGDLLERIDVEVFDLAGRRLARHRTDAEGRLLWRGMSEGGRQLRSGVYFFRALGFDSEGRRTPVARGRVVLLP